MIPISGSAYAYAYVTMGEFIAWIIGWALILEYALASATVSIAWSEYLNSLLGGAIPFEWCHSPMEVSAAGRKWYRQSSRCIYYFFVDTCTHKRHTGIGNLECCDCVYKSFHCIYFIAIGWGFINDANYTPFVIPEGLLGHEAWNRHGWGGVVAEQYCVLCIYWI